MAVMTLRGYARYRKVALSAVQKAIASGRISKLPNGKLDSDIADRDWKINTATYAPAVNRRVQEEDEDGGGSFGASQYTKARAVREHYLARLAKLQFEERTGKLVSKDEVRVAAFNKFRQFRDHVLNIPDRVAAMLAAEGDEAECHQILNTEIRRALNDFTDSNG